MILHGRSRVLEVCLVLFTAHSVIAANKEEEVPAEEDYDPKDPEYNKFYESVAAASASVKKIRENPYGFSFEAFDDESAHGPSDAYGLSDHLKAKATSGSAAYAPAPKEKIDPYEEVRQSVAAALYHKPAASENVAKSLYPEKKQEQAEESVIRPGPHYISHQVPLPDYFKDDEEESAQTKSESETVAAPSKKKKKKTKASQPYYGPTSAEEAEGIAEQTKVQPLTFYGTKNVDYNTGKSSSTVSQYPSASGYLESFQSPSTENPYLQYSFPPVVNYDALQSKYLESIISTPAPQKNTEAAALNPKKDGTAASSENAPESRKNKNCRKIEGPENAENMNCFVCEDAVNKAKYTQCSYAANAEPVNQYAGSSIRYSLPVKAPANFRQKRSPKKGRYSEDPYFLVAERNRKYFDDLDKEQEAEESARQKDFHYTPFDDGEYESYSESQSAELLKQPGACHKVERDGTTCTVCKDPKSGGNFEQCSYSSAPKEQKYAYVAEKKYDSEDDAPEETKVVTKEASGGEDTQKASPSEQVFLAVAPPDNKFTSATKSKIFKDPIPELTAAGSSIDSKSDEGDDDESEVDESDESESKKKEKQISDDYNYGLAPSYSYGYADLKKNRKLVDDDPYDVPEHFAASISKEKKAGYDDDHYDEYHYKLFPELSEAEAEARNEEHTAEDNAQKPQDVEEVLAEFAKKDRSNCKKAEKNGMTCFLCVDQNKVQHEECMYIAESKPRPTHIAYHEVQRLKDPHGEHLPLIDTEHAHESKKVEVTQAADALPSETSKRKKFFKKVITTPLPLVNAELSAAASDVVYKTVVPYEREKKRYVKETIKDSRGAGSAPDSERLEDESTKQNKETEEPESPKEIEVGDEEGAYSHETEPVYSKLYGTVLPKYMVEKTDYEKDFDAASGFA